MQQLQSSWREQGSRSAPRRLQSLSDGYFRAKSVAVEEELPAHRWHDSEEISSWHEALLDALGYTDRQRADIPVDANTLYVPVLSQVTRYNKPWLAIAETPFTLPDSSLKDGRPSEDPLELEPLFDQQAMPR
jgi:hypothetical protein